MSCIHSLHRLHCLHKGIYAFLCWDMVGALAYGLSEVREGWTVTITVVVIKILQIKQ